MKLKYVGPISPVDVPAAALLNVATGDVVDVPDELGVSLLEQADNWTEVSKAKTAPKDGE